MGILSRLAAWANPQLPPLASSAGATLAADGPSHAFASVAYALPDFQQGKALWPTFDAVRAEATYGKVALIFRCLSLIAHAAGTASLRVYDEAQDDDEVADHPLRMLVRQPNPMQGEALFWGTIAMRAALAGFCVAEKERDRLGNVIALNPLRSSWLKALARGRGVYDWEYRIPQTSTVYALKAADVVPFRWADTPDGSPYGLSPLATVVRDVAVLEKLTEFLGNLLDRGGVPMWMLFPKTMPGQTMTQEKIDAMEERFTRRRGAFDRRGLPWIADGFEKAERLSYDPTELAMEAVRDLSDLAICQAFGVPAHKAGTRVGLEHTTQNATAQVEDGAFYRDTIVPLWTRFDDAATTGLLPDFEAMPTTRYLGFDKSDIEALQEDRNAKASAIVIPGFGGGLLSNHMALRELGIPVPDGLPEYYVFSIAQERIRATDVLAVPAATSTTTTTPPPQLGRVTVRELTAGNDSFLDRVYDILEDARREFGKQHDEWWSAGTGPSEAFAKRKAIGAANRRAHIRIAQARKPSLAAFFAGQGERVLANEQFAAIRPYDPNRSVKTLNEFLGGEEGRRKAAAAHYRIEIMLALNESFWQHEDDILRAILERLYLLAGTTAWEQAAEQLGIDLSFDLANPHVRSVMAQLAKRVTGVNDTSRQLIAEAVTKNAEKGGTIEDLKASLKTMFQGWPDYRAEAVARTESQVSYNLASTAAYRESGVVDRIQCFDSPTHHDDYGAEDGLSCSQRNGLIDSLDSADLHINSEHVNGSLAVAPVITGEE